MDAQSPLALLLVGQPTLARQLRMGVFAAYVTVRIMSPSFLKLDAMEEIEGGSAT
jgi:type II secretory pathway predicted ATPase ExeA